MHASTWSTYFRVLACLAAAILMADLTLPMASAADETPAPGRAMAQQATKEHPIWITADHTRHEALKKTFTSGAQITNACLSCHTEAQTQFQKTIHWTWQADNNRGKAGDSLNNFCISANKMADKGCLSCHPGWNKSMEAVNCLACHGQKTINWEESFEDYKAFSQSKDEGEIELAKEIQANIQAAVQNVGLPERSNCGACHFYGGGGDGVKHGDLDSSLAKPNKALDVHMGLDGQKFTCTRCHTTRSHNIAGRIYTAPAATSRKSLVQDDLTAKITCESCHTATPHQPGSKPNDHADKVACQSCHIPTFARVNPTKMLWDWSKAGEKKDGKPFAHKDEFGKEDYLTIKGQMKWEKNVKPSYAWFNGSIESITVKEAIDPSGTVAVSHPVGSREDANSRIFPFKVHMGVQPYDKVNKTLLGPLLSGPKGYWATLDWKESITVGHQALGVPFSGEFDFVKTSYVFPITHMVAPKENAVQCAECHTRKDGRLANLAGFYMPGRDRNGLLNTIGYLAVFGALLGVTIHGLGRVFARGNGKKEE